MEKNMLARSIISLVMFVFAFIVSLGPETAGFAPFLYFMACCPIGIEVVMEAFEHAVKGDVFNEYLLMLLAAIGAFIIGEYPEGAAVMVLYGIGEALQDRAVDRARDNIRSLVKLRPAYVTFIREGVQVGDLFETAKIGDILVVKPGERVPLDGILISGDATFNTSALTGESAPRLIENGCEVLEGMMAADTAVHIRVTRNESESAIARIMKMVEEAASRKAPAELFIRRFARVYTPVVIILAALMAALPWLFPSVTNRFGLADDEWIYRALIFLVISCPCALVISVPLSYFAAIGVASKRGILFKGGNYLDVLRSVDTVVFDKTGTMTTGEFKVVKVDEIGKNDMLSVVAAMEKNSKHPISSAITEYAGTTAEGVEDVKELPGYGLTARRGDDRWIAGTTRLLDRECVAYPDELKNVSDTVVACALNGMYAGCIILGDSFKEDAREAVDKLRAAGVKHIELLSGDRQSTVDKAAEYLKTDSCRGELLPEGKAERIEELKSKGCKVAFVGDGINDAPVLAASHAGIAMGAMGSDVAIETADIVLQTDHLSKVAEAIALGKRTHTIVSQNIIFSIGTKVAVMILGVAGVANLWCAVFADVGVALLAVLNASRLLIYRK